MSAKLLEFDLNRRVPPRHYTPLAMRGKLLHLPVRTAEPAAQPTAKVGLCWGVASGSEPTRRQK